MNILPKQKKWPIRVVMAAVVAAAILITAIALLGMGWLGYRHALKSVATSRAQSAGELATLKTQQMITPVRHALRDMANSPLGKAQTPAERRQYMPALLAHLKSNPLIADVFVGYTQGDFMSVRLSSPAPARAFFHPPAKAYYQTETVTVMPNHQRQGAYHFYDHNHRLLENRLVKQFHMNVHTRPWYQAAQKTADIAYSKPYLFFTLKQPGITLSMSTRQGKAVVGVDMTLTGLNEALATLNVSPHAHLAIVNKQGKIISTYVPHDDLWPDQPVSHLHDQPDLTPLKAADLPFLFDLWKLAPDKQASIYHTGNQRWVGINLPFTGFKGANLRLLVTMPSRDLLQDLTTNRQYMMWLALLILLLFLPLGGYIGHRIGQALEKMTKQAENMSQFDFNRISTPSQLRELHQLNEALNNVDTSMDAILSISHTLGEEQQTDTMLSHVLALLLEAIRCEAGAVYLWQGDNYANKPDAFHGNQALIQNWAKKQFLDEYCPNGLISFTLLGRQQRREGLLVIAHGNKQTYLSPGFTSFTHRLGGMLALTIEKRRAEMEQKALFDAIIHILADAIDTKSPYTGGHCRRVPELAISISSQLQQQNQGPYADYRLDEDENQAFYLAAWLHDVGKITMPEHIVDKATKLETIHNRIHEIRTRFEVLWRDAENQALRAQINGQSKEQAQAECRQKQTQLREDFAFVAECNIGGEAMSDEAIARLQRIGSTTWWRHFDDTLGLSIAEARLRTVPHSNTTDPLAQETLLTDKAEHKIPWNKANKPAVEKDDPDNYLKFDMILPAWQQDNGELHNLCIGRGTLSEEDRFLIKNHMVQTLIILAKLPWPEHLARVPDIASNHHERMDGKGYPRRLHAADLSTSERILGLADVFEALTAADRPYKKAKTLYEALYIMANMSREGHLDPKLFIHFTQQQLWTPYAQKYLNNASLSDTEITQLINIAKQDE